MEFLSNRGMPGRCGFPNRIPLKWGNPNRCMLIFPLNSRDPGLSPTLKRGIPNRCMLIFPLNSTDLGLSPTLKWGNPNRCMLIFPWNSTDPGLSPTLKWGNPNRCMLIFPWNSTDPGLSPTMKRGNPSRWRHHPNELQGITQRRTRFIHSNTQSTNLLPYRRRSRHVQTAAGK